MSRKSKILVVDDDPDALDTMAAILESRNYKIVTALSGLEGISKACKEKPNLIIMDVTMPKLDGFTACKMIREKEEIKGILIILLSGKGLADDMKKGFTAGANDYIIKLVDWDILFLKIKKFIL
jgi:two-component system alkaline phosphatase synthesis response regulator PhoP